MIIKVENSCAAWYFVETWNIFFIIILFKEQNLFKIYFL